MQEKTERNQSKKKKPKGKLWPFLLIVAGIAALIFVPGYVRRHFRTVEVNKEEAISTETVDMKGKNGIIVYFTRVGNTNFEPDVDAVSGASLMIENGTLIGNCELLADMAEQVSGFPTYALTVQDKYSSSYNDTISEARKEMNENKPAVFVNALPDFTEYDTVILIYPLWWGTIPMPVQTFLENTDLEGKTIYSLVSHGGGKYGSAVKDSKKFTKATVSDETLEIYDDDTTKALPKVKKWLADLE